MRVLLSTIGSRGEVQPLLGLALELRARGHAVRVCVPPNFRDWVTGLGFAVTTVGPQVRVMAAPTPEQRRRMIEGMVAAQFAAVPEAAVGCDVVVGCGALQIAAPSVTEVLRIPYVHARYCPITLAGDTEDARRWNEVWRPALNTQRAALELSPVRDVRRHVFTEKPLLAADSTLGPWPGGDQDVLQTGAWIMPDDRPLPDEVKAFLADGEPPVYFGLGSMPAPGEDVGRVLVKAARELGRRAIVARGRADLPLADEGSDCLLIGDANHQALFQRVAAVVHHGGAGTTTTAARAGAPQVVLPQRYDQHYWARRVGELGIGVAEPPGLPTVDSLAEALEEALRRAGEAKAVARSVRTDGARIAADYVLYQV